MNKNNKSKRIRIAEVQFSQPASFIRATGYSSERIRLDTDAVSFHVYSDANRNSRINGREDI